MRDHEPSYRIGVDVGGTFTDFLVAREGAEPRIFKTLSTPEDPAIGLIAGARGDRRRARSRARGAGGADRDHRPRHHRHHQRHG